MSKRKTEKLIVRFTQGDLNTIKDLAKGELLYPSTWVRHIVLSHLKKIGKKIKGGIYEYRRTAGI